MAKPCLLLLLALALVAGCGGDDAGTETDAPLPSAGGGGSLSYAVPRLPASLDPLQADDRTELIVSRQIHEPLVAELNGPYGDTGRQPGLVASAVPSKGASVWTLTLRPGVSFQDGTPFNAAAVLTNARRWTALAAGQRLLPELFAVDAPRPDQVRFLLERPARDLPSRLSSPRLGIVSPGALTGGGRSLLTRDASGSGTGPFEVRASSDRRLELSRFTGWWGSPVGLGPALDQVVFLVTPTSERRLRVLEEGSAQVAEPLERAALRRLAADPLLTAVVAGRSGIGLERSVRGIDSARAVPILSRVWLTDLPS